MTKKPDRPQHPSGRPRHERRIVGRQIWHVPDDGYVTPRLRQTGAVAAIGFVHKFDNGDDD